VSEGDGSPDQQTDPQPKGDDMIAEILARSTASFQDLLDFSRHLDAHTEDLFWKTVNEIRGYTY
jgi:hypothetical protein